MSVSSSAATVSAPGGSSLLSELLPVLAFLRRWWWLALVMVLFSAVTTLAVVILRGVEYQISAALFYKLGPELTPPPTMGKDPLVIMRRAEDVNDEIEILTSPDLIKNVVENLGEDFFKSPPPTTSFGKFKRRLRDSLSVVTGAIEESLIQAGLRQRLTLLEKIELGISRKLRAELVRESDVISVTLDTPAPKAGVTIVQKLIDAYQERHLAVHQEVAVKDFLRRGKEELRVELNASADQLLEFQSKADLWSPDEQQKLQLDYRKSLQAQLATTESRVSQLEKFVEGLQTVISQLPSEIELSRTEQLNPAIVNMHDRIASMNLNRSVVETAYRENSREVENKRLQLEDLYKLIASEEELIPHSTSTGVNVVHQDLFKEHALKQSELDGLRSQLTLEQQQLSAANESMTTLGKDIASYLRLQREHRLLEQKYALYTENFEKADIAAVMNLSQISNVELISPPTSSLEPVRPRLSIVAAVGIASGLALAFMLAVMWELRAASRATVVKAN